MNNKKILELNKKLKAYKELMSITRPVNKEEQDYCYNTFEVQKGNKLMLTLEVKGVKLKPVFVNC